MLERFTPEVIKQLLVQGAGKHKMLKNLISFLDSNKYTNEDLIKFINLYLFINSQDRGEMKILHDLIGIIRNVLQEREPRKALDIYVKKEKNHA